LYVAAFYARVAACRIAPEKTVAALAETTAAGFLSSPMSLDHLEEAINEVTDKDRSWWPFLWLRPEKHVALSLPRLFVISLLYGLPLGALSALLVTLAEPRARANAAPLLALFPLAFFFFATVVIGPMWNRRAERLRRRTR